MTDQPLLAAILEVRGLTKEYPEVKAVNQINFAVRQGICFGLLGPNGAGKTTTIEMMEGLIPPTSGEILYRGRPIDREFSKVMGIQFQSTALQEFLNVGETLKLFRSFYPKPLPLDELIERCALQPLLSRDTRKLSGGQRQRLLLALALVNDPEVIFLDEPTTGLDPQARRNFWSLIEEIKADNKTIILTTHYMEEAQLLCDEIAIMDHGQIIAIDQPGKLLDQHFEGVLVQLPQLEADAAKALPMDLIEQEGFWELCTTDVDNSIKVLLANGVPLTGLRIKNPNLEDLFLKLTGHGLRS